MNNTIGVCQGRNLFNYLLLQTYLNKNSTISHKRNTMTRLLPRDDQDYFSAWKMSTNISVWIYWWNTFVFFSLPTLLFLFYLEENYRSDYYSVETENKMNILAPQNLQFNKKSLKQWEWDKASTKKWVKKTACWNWEIQADRNIWFDKHCIDQPRYVRRKSLLNIYLLVSVVICTYVVL